MTPSPPHSNNLEFDSASDPVYNQNPESDSAAIPDKIFALLRTILSVFDEMLFSIKFSVFESEVLPINKLSAIV